MVSYIEGLDISELTKLDLVNNVMRNAARSWFSFQRRYIENFFEFCEEIMPYYSSIENKAKQKKELLETKIN